MTKITLEYNDHEPISYFSYTTGKLISEVIKEKTENLEKENILLTSKILDFFQKLPEPLKTKYAEHFNITEKREGTILTTWYCIESCLNRKYVPVQHRTSCRKCNDHLLDLKYGK